MQAERDALFEFALLNSKLALLNFGEATHHLKSANKLVNEVYVHIKIAFLVNISV